MDKRVLQDIEDTLLEAAGILRDGGDTNEARNLVWMALLATREVRESLDEGQPKIFSEEGEDD